MTGSELFVLLDFYRNTFDPTSPSTRYKFMFWNDVLTLQERGFVEVVSVLTPIAPKPPRVYVRSEGFVSSPDHFWRITQKGADHVDALLHMSYEATRYE